MSRSVVFRTSAWALALLAVTLWALLPGVDRAWDVQVYRHAMASLRAGHDPYADGIAAQRAYHFAAQRAGAPPFTYVYSPATLPLLRLVAAQPEQAMLALYWLLYAAGALAAILIGMRFIEPAERPLFSILAPAAIFFPGLVQTDVIVSGNPAYILYGAALAAAWRGWNTRRWALFYAVVLAASCVKAPLLVLLAVPIFSARRQWLPALTTGGLGIAMFAVQPVIWPVLFRNFLQAVELQFSYNRDFGAPAGLLANQLYDVVPYSAANTVIFVAYALPVVALLWYLSREFLMGRFPLSRWAPLLLTGVALLNPRIMEYDLAPVTIPMALVAWRLTARLAGNSGRTRLAVASVCFLALNAAGSVTGWRVATSVLLPVLLVAGTWDLLRSSAPALTVDASELPAELVAAV